MTLERTGRTTLFLLLAAAWVALLAGPARGDPAFGTYAWPVEGPVIRLQDLPVDLMLPDPGGRARQAETLPLRQACEQFERQIVLRVLQRVGWNRGEAARLLSLHRNTLKLKLAKWKMRPPAHDG